MIKNIVFDLGNVILKDKPSVVLNNIKINNEECEIIKNTFFSNWDELDLGNVTIEEHLENCNMPINIEKFKEILIEYYKYRAFNEEVVKLMKELKKNNYKIYILSNNNKQAYEYLLKLPIFKCVDGWVVSCDHHIMKPNKKLYEILFDTYNLNPAESFFIDDKKENIHMARILGMNGYVLDYKRDGINELIKNMKENNIKY